MSLSPHHSSLCSARRCRIFIPAKSWCIDIPVSNGFYVRCALWSSCYDEDVDSIRQRMQEIIDARMPIRRYMVPTEKPSALFEEKGDVEKVKLLNTSGSIYTTYYKIGEYVDFYYGTLLTNTSAALSLRVGEVL